MMAVAEWIMLKGAPACGLALDRQRNLAVASVVVVAAANRQLNSGIGFMRNDGEQPRQTPSGNEWDAGMCRRVAALRRCKISAASRPWIAVWLTIVALAIVGAGGAGSVAQDSSSSSKGDQPEASENSGGLKPGAGKKRSAAPRPNAEGNTENGSATTKPKKKSPAKPTKPAKKKTEPPADTPSPPNEEPMPPADPDAPAAPPADGAEASAAPQEEDVTEEEALQTNGPDAQIDPNIPVATQFFSRLNEWHRAGEALRRVMHMKADPIAPEKRRQAIDDVLLQNSQAADQLMRIAEYSYRQTPTFKDAEQSLIYFSRSLIDGDRLEDAVRIGKLLDEHGFAEPRFANMVGRAAYDIGRFDEAKYFLGKARERAELDHRSTRMLEELDTVRERVAAERRRRQEERTSGQLPRVLLRTTRGDIVIELLQKDAPNTVANFLGLVETGFFNGLPFYRVVSGFGAMSGCPKGDGSSGPGYDLFPELKDNHRPHLRGSVSMIASPKGISGSQLFFAFRLSSAEDLDGKQPVMGYVIKGMDVLVRLRRVDPRQRIADLVPDRIVDAVILRERDVNRQVTTTIDPVNQKALQAIEMAGQGRIDEARRILEEVVREYPDHFEANLGLAALAMAQEDMTTAEKFLMRSLEIRPNHPDANFRLGLLFAARQELDASAERFRAVIQLRPRDWGPYNNLVAILSQQQKFDEAIEVLRAAHKVDPDFPQLKETLAIVRAQKDEAKRAAAGASGTPGGGAANSDDGAGS